MIATALVAIVILCLAWGMSPGINREWLRWYLSRPNANRVSDASQWPQFHDRLARWRERNPRRRRR